MSATSATPLRSSTGLRPTGPIGAGFGRRFVVTSARRAASAALAAVLLWRERAHQRRQLAALDDRMLRDIGLTRLQVEEEWRKPFWRA